MSSLPCSTIVDQLILPASLPELADQYHSYALKIRGVLEETAKAERPYLKRFFQHFSPPDLPAELFAAICPKSVTDFLVWYAAQYGPGSRRDMQKTVRMFLRFAYLSGYLPADLSALSPSVRSPRMGRIARSIPAECSNALISSIGSSTPADLRDSAIISLLNTYGVRSVQIRRLRLDDLDWDESRIHFPAAKGGRAIEQHLTAKAGNSLADYITHGRALSSCKELFLTLRKPFRPIPHSNRISHMIKKRMQQAGLELPEGVLYGSNCFRHAFASRLYGQVPFKDIVDMLGHRDPSTTLIYGKLDIPALRRAALPWPGGER